MVSFTPWERVPGTRLIGGWVDPAAGLVAAAKRIYFLFYLFKQFICLLQETDILNLGLKVISFRPNLHRPARVSFRTGVVQN